MLQKLKEHYGDKLAAADGEIGRVKDFYFDDQAWLICYLVVDTGTWLNERQVLLSPRSFGRWNRDERILEIKLTRQQIERSPPIDSHRPVSRQDEQDYHRHYGWKAYWEDGGMWGVVGFPVTNASPPANGRPHHGHNQRDDLHLRSTKAVVGYEIHATDGTLGSVRDFLVDDRSWAIDGLVVETGHWYAGKEIVVRTGKIERINYGDSTVSINLSKADIERADNHSVIPIPPEL